MPYYILKIINAESGKKLLVLIFKYSIGTSAVQNLCNEYTFNNIYISL